MQYKCPVADECKSIFICTYKRKGGKPFDFLPSCFVEIKKAPSVREEKKVVKKRKPKIAQMIVTNKPNIWDDI